MVGDLRRNQHSYGRVAAFARMWKAKRQREQQTTGRGTFVPLVFQPGEAFQFDWSADSDANRPPFQDYLAHLFRDYLAHHSEMISPTIPR